MAVDKGWVCDLRIGATTDLSGASDLDWSNFTMDHDNNLKTVYTGGKRTPEEILEGVIGMKFKLTMPYQVSTYAGYAGVGATGAITTYYLGIFPDGYGETPYWRLALKIGKYSLSTSAEGYLEETMDCEVLSETVVSS